MLVSKKEINRILNLIPKGKKVLLTTLEKLVHLSSTETIISIYKHDDFKKHLKDYEEKLINHRSNTGDYFVDYPICGYTKVDDLVCLTL